MRLDPGTRLGPYEIVELRGKGGMGEVYRARDTRLDRDVAIKVLPAELSEDVSFRKRFAREAKTISRLQHPNVCTLHDLGSEKGLDYLVMEYLEGETLEERLRRGPLPIPDVLRIGREIADAVGAAHTEGMVHRDLKPGNVMLTPKGAKVLDFGLAKGVEDSRPNGPDAPTVTRALTDAAPLASGTKLINCFVRKEHRFKADINLFSLFLSISDFIYCVGYHSIGAIGNRPIIHDPHIIHNINDPFADRPTRMSYLTVDPFTFEGTENIGLMLRQSSPPR